MAPEGTDRLEDHVEAPAKPEATCSPGTPSNFCHVTVCLKDTHSTVTTKAPV